MNLFSKLFGKSKKNTAKKEQPETGVYRLQDRLIYKYWNGNEEIIADPLVLYKKMMARGPELSIDIKVSTSISKDADKAHDQAILKIREIFSVKSLDEGGLTELETVQLLDHFLLYCEEIKKNSSYSVISSSNSDTKPSFRANPPIQNSSASGSIGGESTTGAPVSPPSVSG